MYGCNFDSTDGIIIAEAFPCVPRLRSLDLSMIFIDDTVVEPLIAALVQVQNATCIRIPMISFSGKLAKPAFAWH